MVSELITFLFLDFMAAFYAVKSIFCPVGSAQMVCLYQIMMCSCIAFQVTKCSLFCKTLLCIISFNLSQCRKVICPRSAGQTCLWRAGVTCHHRWRDDLNTDITSGPAFHNPVLKMTCLWYSVSRRWRMESSQDGSKVDFPLSVVLSSF